MAKEINLFLNDLENEKEEFNSFEKRIEPTKNRYSEVFLPGFSEKEALQKEKKTQEQKLLFYQMRTQVKRVIEALLFATNEPLAFSKIREITDTIYEFKPRVLKEIIDELQNEFISKQLVYRLEEIAEGYLLRTSEEFGPYLNLLYRNKRIEKLSQAAAEVLAIIAYRQPVTRPQIEAIRGVDSSGVIQALLERQLIEPLGKLEAPGRPTLFGITKDFLIHFGLKDLKELPQVLN